MIGAWSPPPLTAAPSAATIISCNNTTSPSTPWNRAARLLVPGLLAASAVLHLDPSAAAAAAYPCEDVGTYYSAADGLEGAPLKQQLNSIISPHRSLSYKEVWNALEILDAADVENPESSSEVIEIYSLRAVPKALAGKPEGWNREHLWPRSYGLKEGPSITDLHNLRPADANVNSSRGNKYYGECVATSIECVRPANREAAPDTETNKQRWAPPLQVRGDVARSVLYMAVRYGFDQPDGSSHLQLSDSPQAESSKMGLLSALLQWNDLDPPSREEQLRNDRVCRLYQQNRNPFVDHPEYATLIWKHDTQSNPTEHNPTLSAWVNEFHYSNKGKDQNEFVEIVIGTSSDASLLKFVLYNGANGRVYRSLPLVDMQNFSVTEGGSGFYIYTAFITLQNGPADGIALVSCGDPDHCEVVQFLSYEGIVEATNGPARGTKSVDIMVQETEGSTERDSIGLTGMGVEEFKWKRFIGKGTPGQPNVGQKLQVVPFIQSVDAYQTAQRFYQL